MTIEFGKHRSGGFVEWDGRFVGLHDPPGDTSGFWDGLDQGKLRIKKCGGCGLVLHPRRIVCRSCMSMDLSWIDASGRGTLYSYTTIFRAPHEDWAGRVPYHLGLIQLAEGPFLFSEILCDAPTLSVGLKLEVTVVDEPGGRLTKFKPASP